MVFKKNTKRHSGNHMTAQPTKGLNKIDGRLEEARINETPLASILLLTYNQEPFVRDALRGVFDQTYKPLEIVVSDDCSKDRTYEIVRQETSAYSGPHKILLNRNERNLGLAGNFNRAVELSSGEFLVAHAGDDISLAQRTARLVECWMNKDAPVDLVCSYFEEISVDGTPTGFVKEAVAFFPDTSQPVPKWRCGATGACAGYSRKLFEKYGPMDEHVLSEDWVLPFRAWLENGVAVIREPLLLHRTHNSSISVAQRSLKIEKDGAIRKLRRRQAAANRYGIARDWLRAWTISCKGSSNSGVVTELQRFVELSEMEFKAFDSSRLKALMLAFLTGVRGGGVSGAARLLLRHVLRIQ